MITYIKGDITFRSPSYIIIEAAGIGYHVHISLNTYSALEKVNKGKILTYLLVREDAQSLYGFATEAERGLFLHLISVSGVGASTAQVMLSAMTPDEIRAAIIGEQLAILTKIKGIGTKTAKRIILDIKDKLAKESTGTPIATTLTNNTMREEALSAMLALGFNKSLAQRSLNRILKARPDVENVETLIKLALKEMG
ncbi:MAG TPA: Holliday junction branch migration protein RuvA [Saprospiraceae bacterium]|nr:Holliday junction branch migration protein RuvA [Saprospiraceae bacterium]